MTRADWPSSLKGSTVRLKPVRRTENFTNPGSARGPGQNLPSGETGRVPDIQSQLEGLLDQVWRCEADWRLNDRIDLAVRVTRRAT